MPVRKIRLSEAEKAEDRIYLRQPQAEGIDVETDDSVHDFPLDIMVIGGLTSLIFNLPSGRAGYAIELRLLATKAGLTLPECQITTEFDDQIVLESFDRRSPLCRVGQCQYPRAEVLNDRLPLKFHRRGDMIEGVILATGLAPIPKQYLQGMVVPIQLTFQDQFGAEICIEAELSVDRSTTPRPKLGRPMRGVRGEEWIGEIGKPLVSQESSVPPAHPSVAEPPEPSEGKELVADREKRNEQEYSERMDGYGR